MRTEIPGSNAFTLCIKESAVVGSPVWGGGSGRASGQSLVSVSLVFRTPWCAWPVGVLWVCTAISALPPRAPSNSFRRRNPLLSWQEFCFCHMPPLSAFEVSQQTIAFSSCTSHILYGGLFALTRKSVFLCDCPMSAGTRPSILPFLPSFKDCWKLSSFHPAFPISWLLSTPSLVTVLDGNSFVCSENVPVQSVWLSDLYINFHRNPWKESLLVTSLPLLPLLFCLDFLSVPSLNYLRLSRSVLWTLLKFFHLIYALHNSSQMQSSPFLFFLFFHCQLYPIKVAPSISLTARSWNCFSRLRGIKCHGLLSASFLLIVSSVVRLSPPQLPCLGECIVPVLPSTLARGRPLPSLSLSREAPLSQWPLCLARGFPVCLQPCPVLSSGSTPVHLRFLASLSIWFCKSSGLSHVCVTQSFFLLPPRPVR